MLLYKGLWVIMSMWGCSSKGSGLGHHKKVTTLDSFQNKRNLVSVNSSWCLNVIVCPAFVVRIGILYKLLFTLMPQSE